MLVSQDADLKSENRKNEVRILQSRPTIMPHLAITETDQTRSRPPSTRTRSLRTTDFDELGAALPGWGVRLIQLGRGPFDGRVVLAQHGRFQLYEFEGNRTILARGASPAGSYEFNVIHEQNSAALWRGRTLRPGMINIRVPGEPLDHRTTEKYRSTGLNVDAQFVQRVASVLHGVDAEPILRGPFVTTDREHAASLDRSLRRALVRLATGTESEPRRQRHEDLLVEWLSAVLGRAVPDRFREPISRGSQSRAAVVRQAEEYMLAHLHRSLSLLEICEVVGASERTLLYSFRERTGQSPKAYLSALKLNRLRQDLKEADPRVDSVHALALQWGLVHSGSLAADYRRLFGELPHQTLHRGARIILPSLSEDRGPGSCLA